MALVVRKTASKLEDRFKDALVAFENVLDKDQKARFDELRVLDPPSIDGAMVLTAEISRASGSKLSLQAPRLTKVLSTVQAFTSLIDLVVSGSQNLIASSVWGVLKTTLESATRSIDFFDRLSDLLMTTGRSCPDYRDLCDLFPHAKILQEYFSEYIIVILSLCTKSLLFLKKSRLNQIAHATVRPFDSEFAGERKDLIKWTEAIKLKILVLTQQSEAQERRDQAKERDEGSLMRKIQLKFFKTAGADLALLHEIQLRQSRDAFLKKCSTYDSQSTWRQLRKRGNASWILSDAAFCAWRDSQSASNFCCVGKLGSGKSVIAAYVVEDLTLSKKPQDIVAYHFCRDDEEVSQDPRVIAGCIARQIFSVAERDEIDWYADRLDAGTDGTQLAVWLNNLDRPNSRIFVILDGLDSCPRDALQTLWSDFLKPCENIFSLYYSRKENIMLEFTGLVSPLHTLSIDKTRPTQEIEDYIDQELETALESGELVLGDPELILVIRDALVENAYGMFLWVYLQLKTLVQQPSDDDILACLQSLPKDLPSTYNRIWEKMETNCSAAQFASCKKIFEILFAALRPLSVAQLREALSVEPGDPIWNKKAIINDMGKLVSRCGGLLRIEEEDESVQFTHPSIKCHVASYESVARINAEHANWLLAAICVTYLQFGELDRRLARKTVAISGQKVLNRTILATASEVGSKNLALAYLRKKSRLSTRLETDMDINRQIREIDSHQAAKEADNTDLEFESYARQFWLQSSRHLFLPKLEGAIIYNMAYGWGHSRVEDLLHPMFRSKSGDIDASVESLQLPASIKAPLSYYIWAMRQDNFALSEWVVHSIKTSYDSESSASIFFGICFGMWMKRTICMTEKFKSAVYGGQALLPSTTHEKMAEIFKAVSEMRTLPVILADSRREGVSCVADHLLQSKAMEYHTIVAHILKMSNTSMALKDDLGKSLSNLNWDLFDLRDNPSITIEPSKAFGINQTAKLLWGTARDKYYILTGSPAPIFSEQVSLMHPLSVLLALDGWKAIQSCNESVEYQSLVKSMNCLTDTEQHWPLYWPKKPSETRPLFCTMAFYWIRALLFFDEQIQLTTLVDLVDLWPFVVKEVDAGGLSLVHYALAVDNLWAAKALGWRGSSWELLNQAPPKNRLKNPQEIPQAALAPTEQELRTAERYLQTKSK